MVSVVIPAYNEEKNIGATLESLASQVTEKKFEVVVVDNASTDRTAQVVAKFKKKINLRVIKEPIKGRGTARAAGFREARGEIIFSTDADTIVPPNWIESALGHFKTKNTVAVTGPWKMEDVIGFTKFFLNSFQEVLYVYPTRIAFGHPMLTGFNFAVRKKIYQKSGGFNNQLNAHEDIDLSRRLSKYGKIIYTKDMKTITSGRRFKDGLLQGFFSYQKEGIKLFIFKNKKILLKDKR